MKKAQLKKPLALSITTVRALDRHPLEHVAGAGFVYTIIALSNCAKPTMYCTLSAGSCGGGC